MRQSVKALAIAIAGIVVMQLPVRHANAQPLGGDCIRGCCFCIDNSGGQTCLTEGFGDLDCYARGCGAFVQCYDPGETQGCTGNQLELECVP
jgi:hypothetical protein